MSQCRDCDKLTAHNLLYLALQIKHMMAFIEQEAKEKAEEIDAKVRMSESYLNNIFICPTY